MDQLPDDIRGFVAANIDSVSQLEAMLLLRGSPEKTWMASDVARTLYATETMVKTLLNELVDRRLLERNPVDFDPATPTVYCFAPRTADLDRLTGALAVLYRDRRATLISMIYARIDPS